MFHQARLAVRATDGRRDADAHSSAQRPDNVPGKGRGPALLAVWCLTLVMLCIATPALAQPARPTLVGVRVGLADHYKLGRLTPVEVTLRGGSETVQGDLQLTAADGDGVPVVYPPANGLPVHLQPGQETRVTAYVQFGQALPELNVELIVDGRRALSRSVQADDTTFDADFTVPRSTDEQLVLVVGSDVGVEQLQQTSSGRSPLNMVPLEVARLADVSQLPTRPYGYEAFDWVVLTTDAPELYRQLSPAQLQALEQWVHQGGKLLLAVSNSAPELLAPGEPLARFVPGEYVDIAPQQGFAAGQIARVLESYSHSKRPIPNTEGDLVYGVEFQIPRIEQPRGEVLLEHDGLPLAIRQHPGFGQILFVGLPLGQQPLAGWTGRSEVVNRLMGTLVSEDESNNYYYYHYELISQLRSRLDEFTGVQFVSFWTIAFLIIVYILLIGPVDYFLVRHVFKRMELTWVTFPCIVGLVSVGAYVTAYWLKGSELRLNRAEIVDLDLQSGTVRGTAWFNLFSPQMATYDLHVEPRLPSDSTTAWDEQLLWFSPPGGGLGGLGGQGSMFSRQYYSEDQLARLAQVPVQVWSSKSFQSRWHGALTTAPISASLRPAFGEGVEGTLVNRLDVPLEDAALLVGPWALSLGDIAPGEEVEINRRVRRQGITGYLTGQTGAFDEPQNRLTVADFGQNYNTSEAQLLQAMGFFQAAGGATRLNISDAFTRWLDLSGHLTDNKAILVFSGPGTTQLVGTNEPLPLASDEVTTLYRVIIPLEAADEAEAVDAENATAAETSSEEAADSPVEDMTSEATSPEAAPVETESTIPAATFDERY